MKESNSKQQIYFDREEHIQNSRFQILLESFDGKSMEPEELRSSCDTLQILFCGFSEVNEPPFVVPEIRAFTRQVHTVWPFAAFFCDATSMYLVLDAFAVLEHFIVIQRDRSRQMSLTVDESELRQYAEQTRATIQELGTRAGLSESDIAKRRLRLNEHLSQWLGPRLQI
jgi:hypothetical protein